MDEEIKTVVVLVEMLHRLWLESRVAVLENSCCNQVGVVSETAAAIDGLLLFFYSEKMGASCFRGMLAEVRSCFLRQWLNADG
ncbi:hypothetical protein KFK09_028478 [Dendrobium nobile]|uniref:Uncharacterized protein n=1 Tax=Dendrobium nobile TaxID=94219 RepID=A0A8T3A3F1_DENNO|nr:hypothetical protein KFK09_028478 [Dendrobium nobile]